MSNADQPFALRGNTRRITATPRIATTAIRVLATSPLFPSAPHYILTNLGPSMVFVGYGPDRATAIDNAAVPVATDTAGTFCVIVPPGQRGIEAPAGSWFAAVTESGTADLLITPGYGKIDGFGDGSAAATAAINRAFGQLVDYAFGQQQELLTAILTEARVQTEMLRDAHGIADSVESLRNDQASVN